MLTNESKQQLKQRLIEERQCIIERIKSIDQGGLNQSLGESIGELSVYDNHPGDVASEVFERSKDFSLRDNAMLIIRAIDDALEKMDTGAYGECDVCGKEIFLERLEAVPYTTLCIQCKEDDEKLTGTGDRPVEEEVMADIYSIPFDDEINNVAFDWEDSFQEVARWNEHAVRSGAGSYYGAGELVEEDQRGVVEDVDNISYEVDEGVIYQSFQSVDDEGPPGVTDND